jgi:hypothetical protein
MAFAPELQKAWAALTQPLGLAGASLGQSVKSSGDAPRFAGVVQHAGTKAYPELMLRLEQPGPGSANISAMPMGGQVCLYLCLYLYGDGARAIVAREAPVWQAWLGKLFPAPVGQPGA